MKIVWDFMEGLGGRGYLLFFFIWAVIFLCYYYVWMGDRIYYYTHGITYGNDNGLLYWYEVVPLGILFALGAAAVLMCFLRTLGYVVELSADTDCTLTASSGSGEAFVSVAGGGGEGGKP